ncbi:hypothetical protein AWZ03_015221, partial [Drosophila navojoa]
MRYSALYARAWNASRRPTAFPDSVVRVSPYTPEPSVQRNRAEGSERYTTESD